MWGLFLLPKYPATFFFLHFLIPVLMSGVYSSFLGIPAIPAVGKHISLTSAVCFVEAHFFDPCISVDIAESV